MASDGFNVYLNGKHIDKVFQSRDRKGKPADAAEVKRSLVEHDGYDPAITVRRDRARVHAA